MSKDYGAILTRYLDPSETGFDTVVFQAGNQVLDSEFVLKQEVLNQARSALIKQTIPSGFLSGDFLQDGNEDFDFRAEANIFHLINKPVVNVNGWIIPLEYTATSTPGENQIELPAPPAGSGNMEVDFVYLEVWRALVAPDPSDTNKPNADKIWRHGNVLSTSPEWLDDDLIDPAVSSESSKRVQVQYKISTRRLNSNTNRLGYTDSAIVAQGPNAAVTTWSFTGVPSDPGLWRAGDGNPSNTLNTVDGYVYSIPICMVIRRNSDGFEYVGNGNGAVLLSAGTSDRPDGLFADEIVFDDVLDLRRSVSLSDRNWNTVLERNTSLLMDQELRTWLMLEGQTDWEAGGNSGGGNYLLKGDTLNHGGGDPSGNPFGHPDPRESDGICRVFSDRAHLAKHVVVYSTGTDWDEDDILSLDISGFSVPTGAHIADVASIVVDEGQVEVNVKSITGLGTLEVDITLNNQGFSSSRDIWVEYEISYPIGGGLNAHVSAPASNFQVNVNDPTAFNGPVGTTFTADAAGREAVRDYVFARFSEGPHREVTLVHTTEDAETIDVISVDANTVILPEYLYEDAAGTSSGVVSVTIGATPYSVDASATSGRTIILSDALPSANEEVTVEYYPERPLPDGVGAVTLYYMTPALQAIPKIYLDNADPDNRLTVTPVVISDRIFVATSGTGSQGIPFPYEAPMNQIPVHHDLATVASGPVFRGMHDLNAPGPISITSFEADTGFLSLPVKVPMAPVSSFTLLNTEQGNVDYEQLDHYRDADPDEYRPSAFTESLSTVVGHQCFLPMIAKLAENTSYAREGEHVLVVFSKFIAFSEENNIGFTDTDNTTCAALYRLKGSPVTY